MIDLYGQTAMADDQITCRVVAIIRQQFMADDESNLILISVGSRMAPKLHTLTPAEEIELAKYQKHVLAAKAVGVQAREDNKLLADTLAYERATTRLEQPVLTVADYPDVKDETGKLVRNPVLVTDDSERTAAQAVITAATKATLALVKKRAAAQVTVA